MKYGQDKEYISSSDIAKYVDQMEVWWWLLGFQVDEGEEFKNPWRVDNNPGCKLDSGYKWIFLQDRADVRFHSMTIIDATKYVHQCTMDQACNILWNIFVLGKNKPITPTTRQTDFGEPSQYECNIHFIPYTTDKGQPMYLVRDKMYWSPLGVSSSQLAEDYTYSVKMYRFNDKNGRQFQVYPVSWCYAYTFPSGNVKIYSPNKHVGKWVANTSEYDIGGLSILPNKGDALFVCKSYKDWRIQINLGYDAVWIQGEKFLIPEDYIKDFNMRFNKILIYFDNDRTGIEMSDYLADHCNKLVNSDKFEPRWLPEQLHDQDVTDNAEFYLKFGEDALIKQINSFLL